MIKNYWLRVTLFAIGGLLVGLLIAVLTPKKYEAITAILVNQKPAIANRAISDAEAATLDLLESSAPRTVQTQVEQMTGFGVLIPAAQATAEALGLGPIGEDSELSPRNLSRSITIQAAQESDIIQMSVRLSSKDLAKETARQIYLAFDNQNQTKSREVAERAIESIEKSAAKVAGELKAVDAKVHALRRETGIAEFMHQVAQEVQSLRHFTELRDQTIMDIEGQRLRLAKLQATLAATEPRTYAGSAEAVNPLRQQLVGQLYALRAERAQAIQRWDEDRPEIKEIDARIRNLEANLNRESPDIRSHTSTQPNPLWQNINSDIKLTMAGLGALEKRLEGARAEVAKREAALLRYPDIQRRLEDLMREQNRLTAMNQQYTAHLDNLRLVQRGRLTTTAMLGEPYVDRDPVVPNYPLNIGAGLLVGIFLGLLSAFRTESKRSPIRTLAQMNRMALQPSFRVIPELPYSAAALDRQPADPYMALLGNFLRTDKRPYRLGVFGVDRGAGATTTAINLAAGAALEGNNTLLVDTGKTDEISRRLNLSAAGEVITPKEHLSILRRSGAGDESSQAIATIEQVNSLAPHNDLVVVDLAPYRERGNSALFATGLDECILLVRAGQTKSIDFLQAQQMLLDVGVPAITVVFARATSSDDDLNVLQNEPATRALAGR